MFDMFRYPCYYIYRYSYVGDMMATQHPHTSAMPTHDFHVLGSQRDTQEQCARLELENVKLYNENKDLRKEIDDLRMQLQETQHGQPDGNIYNCFDSYFIYFGFCHSLICCLQNTKSTMTNN